jgi:hypothetical protein
MALHSAQWLTIIFKFLPMVINLAESFFGPKTGEQKKEFVIESTKNVITGIKDISTGGQKETLDIITTEENMGVISLVIDWIVDAMFNSDDDHEIVIENP